MNIFHRIVPFTLITLVVVIILNCSEEDEPCCEPPPRSLNGYWSGTIENGGIINLLLVQSGNSIMGIGFVATAILNDSCNVLVGTYDGTNISITLSVQNHENIMYVGKIIADNIHKGNLNGSGFMDENVTFIKQ